VRRWLAIVNPAAGLARANRRLVRRLVSEWGAHFEIATTGGRGDGARLARAAAGYEGLLAVGGDGTIAEVLGGMELPRQTLALLPAGHGNCLARDLGIGTPELAFAALGHPRATPLDLMRVRVEFSDGRREQRLAASTVAVGYVAEVVALGRRRLAALGGLTYTAAALLTCARPRQVRVGEGATLTPRHLTNLVVNNTAHLANFRAFPDARLDDGRLDVLEASYGWGRQMLHNAAILAGSRRFGPAALWQAPAVAIENALPARLMVDGELLEEVARVTLECLPGAVRWAGVAR
jgi:diacylglycerol kinase (ATP)